MRGVAVAMVHQDNGASLDLQAVASVVALRQEGMAAFLRFSHVLFFTRSGTSCSAKHHRLRSEISSEAV